MGAARYTRDAPNSDNPRSREHPSLRQQAHRSPAPAVSVIVRANTTVTETADGNPKGSRPCASGAITNRGDVCEKRYVQEQAERLP